MNKRIEEELFPFYALGVLTKDEQAEVDAYVAADPEAQARLDALRQSADALPLGTEPVHPSPGVKATLMARVQADAQARQTQAAAVPRAKRPIKHAAPQPTWWERLRQSFAIPALAGTAALAAILLFIWAISLSQQVDQLRDEVADLSTETGELLNELTALREDNASLQVRNDALQQQLDAQNDILASYQQPGTQTIAISDITGDNPEARATLTVAPEAAGATFVAANLPLLDSSQVYQLWIIRGEQPLSAGIFEVDETGTAVFQVEGSLAATFDAVGVSIEPAGGSDTPTPDQIILLGAASS